MLLKHFVNFYFSGANKFMIVILVFFELIPVILPISSNYFSALTTGSPASEQEYIKFSVISTGSEVYSRSNSARSWAGQV